MSASQLQVVHYKDRRCKFSESVDLKINNKTIVSPTFAPRLKNKNELKLYLEVKSAYAPMHLSVYVTRLFDVGKTLYFRLKRASQTNLLGETTDAEFSSSLMKDVILVDPALEYLYYTANMNRLAHSPYVSRSIKAYATDFVKKREKLRKDKSGTSESIEEFKEANHTNFWTCMYKDASRRMKLIRDTFNVQMKSRADILIPPVPLIASSHLLDVAIFMNEKSRAYAEGKRECADYFVIKQKILRNEHMMSQIKEYIANSTSPLTVFKFKNLDLTNPDLSLERSAFKSLLMELSFLSSHIKNKSFALFESGNQTFPSALTGFAIVSTSFSLDREDRHHRKKRSPFANWYDPMSMTFRDKQTLSIMMDNNDGHIPCNCPICTESPSFMKSEFTKYNRKTKRHYTWIRNQEMKEIFTAIKEQDALMGFEKLQRSSLKNLTDIIPR